MPLEIADIESDQDQVVDDRGRGNQPVDIAARPECGNAAPFQSDLVGDRQDSIRVVMAQALEPRRAALRYADRISA